MNPCAIIGFGVGDGVLVSSANDGCMEKFVIAVTLEDAFVFRFLFPVGFFYIDKLFSLKFKGHYIGYAMRCCG